jgi:hypothetical protein
LNKIQNTVKERTEKEISLLSNLMELPSCDVTEYVFCLEKEQVSEYLDEKLELQGNTRLNPRGEEG